MLVELKNVINRGRMWLLGTVRLTWIQGVIAWQVVREYGAKAILGRRYVHDSHRTDIRSVAKHYEYSHRQITPVDRLRQGGFRVVNDRLAWVDMASVRRSYVEQLHLRLQHLRPERVLEVGAGQGVNLVGLSCWMRDCYFVGIELTWSGTLAAKLFQGWPIGEIGGPVTEVTKRVWFVQGNGLSLPFRDNTFDCSFTCLTLEQLPKHWGLLVDDLRRVTRSHCVFLEPFWEAQVSTVNKMHLWSRNYFCESYRALENRGFKVLEFSRLVTRHNPRVGVGICLTRVT